MTELLKVKLLSSKVGLRTGHFLVVPCEVPTTHEGST